MSVAITAPGEAVTWGSNKIFSANGAASTPPVLVSGTWFSGGSATTTKPQLLIEPAGTTSTGWSTSGTGLGVNAPSGFVGNILDAQLNGVSIFRTTSTGSRFGTSPGVVITGGEIQAFDANIMTIGRTATSIVMFGNWAISSDGGTPNTISFLASVGSAAFGGVNRANALNGLTITPKASGSAPTISATGFADTSVSISLVPKGGGAVRVDTSAFATGATALIVTPGAHTAVVAEVIDSSFAAHTMTITGSYATNRFNLFENPTITAGSALTVTNAATFAIAGAPIVAGSAVITNPFAAWIQSGSLAFTNAGEPTTSPADIVQAYAVDIAAGRATLGLRTEEAVAVDIGLASTSSLTVKINGTLYKIPLVAV